MLKSLINSFRCPKCKIQPSNFFVVPFRETKERVIDGLLKCLECQNSYVISDTLLELVIPELSDRDALSDFQSRYASQLDCDGGYSVSELNSKTIEALAPQYEQRNHFDWYASPEGQTYTEYQDSSFWRSVDLATFERLEEKHLPQECQIVDIGCADGRSAFQLLGEKRTVVGFDVSHKMLRRAVERSRSMKVDNRISFFVGDGDQIPFQDESQRFICTYGVLHHLPNANQACKEIYRVLKSGGVYIGSENNDSAFRGVFDFLMQISPLWTELAGEEPLISRPKLEEWFGGLSYKMESYTSVYLPPHIFNLFDTNTAKKLLMLSDKWISRFPYMKTQGGLIVYMLTKTGEPIAITTIDAEAMCTEIESKSPVVAAR